MTTDQNPDLRAQLLDALDFAYCQGLGFDTPEALLAAYDASCGVSVPPPADQTATLRAVVARIGQMADYWEQRLPEVIRTPAVVSAIRAALEPAEVLRRMAAEEQPAETQTLDCDCLSGSKAKRHAPYCPMRQLPETLGVRLATTEPPAVGEQPETQETHRCVCGDPIEWWTGPDKSAGWIHSPDSNPPFLDIHKPRPAADQQP